MRPLDEHARTIGLLMEADMLAALRYLNGLTRYHFTGLYLFRGETARNWFLVDRQQPERLLPQEEVPVEHTYCAFTRNGLPFTVTDSLADQRLGTHPARDAVRAYHGAPLVSALGVTLGSLCHFDNQPVDPVSAADAELLEVLVPLFADKLAEMGLIGGPPAEGVRGT